MAKKTYQDYRAGALNPKCKYYIGKELADRVKAGESLESVISLSQLRRLEKRIAKVSSEQELLDKLTKVYYHQISDDYFIKLCD
ncbi:MAG: hypothetical protein KDD50_16680 [Bdellovibrionales bacterium]|nr:hypothetical protein [Bdellovibrionales bacterium]